MISRKFDTPDGDRTVPVFAEEFADSVDLLKTLESRKPWSSLSGFDYMHGAKPMDPEWSGFRDSEFLRDRLLHGITEDRLAREARRSAEEVKVQERERLRRVERKVCGGTVCTPAYLSGNPRNMWTVSRQRVQSRILHMCIDSGLSLANSAADYRVVGNAIVKTIAGLEGAGYRVRVTAAISAHEYMRGQIHMLGLPLKTEKEPMDFAKILYPLTDVSFFRGIGFSWLATNPDFNPADSGLGNEVQCAFLSPNTDRCLDDLYKNAFGPNAEYIPIRDMAKMVRRGLSPERLRGYMESRILNLDA